MNKFFEINELKNKLKFLRKKNKIIGLCHGVFDLLHVGHIRHFKLAKKKVDFLILSITCSNIGLPNAFIKGLGLVLVRGKSLLPIPPAIIITWFFRTMGFFINSNT